MIRFSKKSAGLAAMLCAAAITALSGGGCSGYFSPWSAFAPPEYDLGAGAFAPDAAPISVPDSVSKGIGSQRAVWYSFPALKDTTYVVVLYPRFDNAVLDIYDTASQGAVASVRADSSVAPSATLIWLSKRTGVFYLRVRTDSVSYDGSAPLPGAFGLSLKSFEDAYANADDVYEPDSAKSCAAHISYALSGVSPEVFQIHRLSPGDTDWFVFSPNYSHWYSIRTVGSVDTKISMMSVAADSVVAQDDNSGGAKNAKLLWVCPYSPDSYARYFYVTGSNAGAYGISVMELE